MASVVRVSMAAVRRARLEVEAVKTGRLQGAKAQRALATALEVLDTAAAGGARPAAAPAPHAFALRLQVLDAAGRPQATVPATGQVWETDCFICKHFSTERTPARLSVRTCLLRQEARHEGVVHEKRKTKVTRARALREQLGLSLRAMAARLGISDETLRSLESGTKDPRHRAGAKVRAKVAAALGCSPDELGRMEKATPRPAPKRAGHYPYCASGVCEQGKDLRARCSFQPEWAWSRGQYHAWRPDVHDQRQADRKQRRAALGGADLEAQPWMDPVREAASLTPDDDTPY